MTHSSWNNERGAVGSPGDDNERMEYLGDAALELIVGEYLFKRFPSYDEGQLTQLRAALVNTGSLARLAERLELGGTLLVGKGAAKTGARQLPSLLANAFEALIGAIFLDQGLRVAARVFVQSIGDLAEWSDENFKGRLQELYQDRMGVLPSYRVAAGSGQGSRREYSAAAVAAGEVIGEGTGLTKQAAEQAAARVALERLAAVGGAASRAAGAALAAAQGVSAESARVRRRVAEVAAERSTAGSAGGGRARRREEPPAGSAAAEAPPGQGAEKGRGLLRRLRQVAEGLVGRPPGAALDTPDEPPAPVSAQRSRSRRRRGSRGRGGRPSVGEPRR